MNGTEVFETVAIATFEFYDLGVSIFLKHFWDVSVEFFFFFFFLGFFFSRFVFFSDFG